MQNFSKYFNLDTIDTNQTLKPIIVITDSDNNVLFTLAQDQDEVFNNNGDSIDIINSISKVSNVKISNDFDTKKLKINRLRCTLYNYYDVNTKLSEYVNTGIINKNLYLFYKSPTTNIINFSDTQGDYDCALIYAGEISRIKFDDAKIDITAEDKTQIKIADKQVPYMSVDKLPLEIRERITKPYQEEDSVVPMTFGKVDKAPVLPHIDINNDRHLNILLEVQPTTNNHTTARIPSLLDSQPNDAFNCLYVKENDDYIVWDHKAYTLTTQNTLYPNFKILNLTGTSNNYLIPEIQTDYNSDLKMWDFGGFHQRMIKSVFASSGSLLDISYQEADNMSNDEFENISAINDNGGYEKRWYRQGDEIQTGISNFDTGGETYTDPASSLTDVGAGRWILLQLEEGVSNELLNLRIDDIDSGNTFVLSDWLLYQDEDLTTVSNVDNLDVGTYTGFFIAPIVSEVWRDIIPRIQSQEQTDDWNNILLDVLVVGNPSYLETINEQLDEEEPDTSLLLGQGISGNPYINCPLRIHKELPITGGARYWGSYGASNGLNENQLHSGADQFQVINGFNYGDTISLLSGGADQYNNIAVFEYISPYLRGTFKQGLKMNNIGFLHSVKIENMLEQEIYTSITGRRNEFYTGQLSYDYIPPTEEIVIPDVPISDITGDMSDVGEDSFDPDTAFVYKGFSVRNTTAGWFSASVGNPENLDNVADANAFINNFIAFGTEAQLGDAWQQFIGGDYNQTMMQSYTLFRDYYCNLSLLPMKLLQIVDAVTLASGSQFAYSDIKNTANHEQFISNNERFTWALYKHFYEYVFQTNMNLEEVAIGFDPNDYEGGIDFGQGPNWDFWVYCNHTGEGTEWYEYNENSWDYNSVYIPYYGYYYYWTYNLYTVNDVGRYKADMSGFAGSLNSWDSYEINTLQDWIDNLYVHMDDFAEKFTTHFTSAWNTALQSADEQSGYANNSNHLFPTTDANVLASSGYPFANSLSVLEGNTIFLDFLQIDLLNLYGIDIEPPEIPDSVVINKPSDIIMNILTNEMGFSKYSDSQVVGQDVIIPNYNGYDIESIVESRSFHDGWQMGFSVNKKTDGKKLIEEILKESKSYPRFTSDGRFGLITIKESYTYDDIDMIIDTNDIIKYNFNQTKREDVITSVKMFYRYDYGLKKYNNYLEKKITEILPEYQGYDYYNVNPNNIDTHRDINLKYHTDSNTVNDFTRYTLLNNCNVHNEINMALPLNYSELEVGDIIHFPLINNTKAFDIDYSVVDYLNGLPVYPLWIIMSTDLGMNDIKIKAVQLHYLGTTNGIADGNHQFQFPEEDSYQITGNMQESHSALTFTDGSPMPNWNYNPFANVDSGFEIPYFDINGDGVINVTDIVAVINHILGTSELSQSQKDRLKYRSNGSLKQDNIINVIDLVSMVNMILQEGDEELRWGPGNDWWGGWKANKNELDEKHYPT